MLLDYSINILSILLILIIIYSILCSTLYLDKYENFINNNDKYKEIYKKCPRGCGHHYTVPNCNECTSEKKDYDKGTIKDNEWIDKYHIKGDQNEAYIENIIKEWKKINPNTKFIYEFLKEDFYEKKIYKVNLHPNYLIKIYEKYNPEKNSNNIYNITKWIENIQEDLSKYKELKIENKIEDLKYLDIEPEEWIDKKIYEILMKKKEISDEYLKTIDNKELLKYNIKINKNTKDKSLLNIEEIKKYLEKIFDGCDINKDSKISNSEELRYIYLSNKYITDKDNNDLEKYENKILEEINIKYDIKSFNKKIKNREISTIWQDIYNIEKEKNELIPSLNRETYIEKILQYIVNENYNTDKINYISNIIVYSLKYLEKNNLIDI